MGSAVAQLETSAAAGALASLPLARGDVRGGEGTERPFAELLDQAAQAAGRIEVGSESQGAAGGMAPGRDGEGPPSSDATEACTPDASSVGPELEPAQEPGRSEPDVAVTAATGGQIAPEAACAPAEAQEGADAPWAGALEAESLLPGVPSDGGTNDEPASGPARAPVPAQEGAEAAPALILDIESFLPGARSGGETNEEMVSEPARAPVEAQEGAEAALGRVLDAESPPQAAMAMPARIVQWQGPSPPPVGTEGAAEEQESGASRGAGAALQDTASEQVGLHENTVAAEAPARGAERGERPGMPVAVRQDGAAAPAAVTGQQGKGGPAYVGPAPATDAPGVSLATHSPSLAADAEPDEGGAGGRGGVVERPPIAPVSEEPFQRLLDEPVRSGAAKDSQAADSLPTAPGDARPIDPPQPGDDSASTDEGWVQRFVVPNAPDAAGTFVPPRAAVPDRPAAAVARVIDRRRVVQGGGMGDVVAAAPQSWRQYAAEQAGQFQSTARRTAGQALLLAQPQIVRQARYMVWNGRSEFSLRLEPPELGHIKVELAMKDGQMEVRFRVADPQVRECIRNDLTDLARSLRDAQVDVGRFDVLDYDSGGGDEPRGPAGDGRSRRAAPMGVESPPEEGGPALHGWTTFTASGGIDCFV